MNPNRIIIVGAGPAGLMAAIRASSLHSNALLIEKNPVCCKKLLLSGKGRCNLTNACQLEDFLKRFGAGKGQFLRDAFKLFFNKELMDFFQDRGLRLKIERQQRVFPVTDSSSSVADILKKELERNKVIVRYKTVFKKLAVENFTVKGVFLQNDEYLPSERVIMAMGGISYGFTGSTGDWIKPLEESGHGIIKLRPALIALKASNSFIKKLEGLTLKNIRFTVYLGKKEVVSETGELLFTHNGVSGPLILSLSGDVVDWLKDNPGKNAHMTVDFKPALSEKELDQRILREIKLYAGKNVKNMLKSLLPQRFIEVFGEVSFVSLDKKANQVTADERKRIVGILKAFPLEIVSSLPIEQAMVTRGGVSLKEINPKTMESRIIKGLYFAGEMIDVDADTGGFNLQAAFSTGYLAGESCSAVC